MRFARPGRGVLQLVRPSVSFTASVAPNRAGNSFFPVLSNRAAPQLARCSLHFTAPAAPTSTGSSLLPVLGNVAYIALASGFLMTDVLALRVLLAGGYTALVGFHALQAKPLWIPLGWSCVFVAVNSIAASLLIADRWPGSLTPEEERLHADSFSQLTRGQFRLLMGMGERVVLPRGAELTREAEPCDSLYFITNGCAKLYLRQSYAADIEKGGFVNDVAFQAGAGTGAYGTVVVSSDEDCTVVRWDQADLREFIRSRPEMQRNLSHVLVATLVQGLLMQREAAHATGQGWSSRDAEAAPAASHRPARLAMTKSMNHLYEVVTP